MGSLLATTVVALGVSAFCAWGWYREATRLPALEDLSSEVRQALVESLLQVSPGVHEPASYEPRIGYTLKGRQELSIWNDTFTSNVLGLRTGPLEKVPGTFRVVFVGDSWTYGAGVKAAETFPEVFARLAKAQGRNVDAWTLALPGWNTFSEMAALRFFYDQLQPDAVVICPTNNDNHSLATVAANGSLARSLVPEDHFGDPHSVTYLGNYMDSYRFHERWRVSFAELRETEKRLVDLDVPLMFYFIGPWFEDFTHSLVSAAGLTSPYLIMPRKYSARPWQNPPPIGHATADGNRILGHLVYQGLAEVLGWSLLPPLPEEPNLALYRRPPDQDWAAAGRQRVRNLTPKHLPESFVPGLEKRLQDPSPIELKTGRMGRATTLLIRRKAGARRLNVAVARLPEAPSLYPLRLTVRVPAAAGGSRVDTVVPATGPDLHRFSLEIPDDPSLGSVLDVTFEAERVASSSAGLFSGRSLAIASITQE